MNGESALIGLLIYAVAMSPAGYIRASEAFSQTDQTGRRVFFAISMICHILMFIMSVALLVTALYLKSKS